MRGAKQGSGCARMSGNDLLGRSNDTCCEDTLARRKRSKFSVGREVRRRARKQAGQPPPARVIANKRTKPPKHKRKLLEEESE